MVSTGFLHHAEWIAVMQFVLLDFLQSRILPHHKQLLEHPVIFGITSVLKSVCNNSLRSLVEATNFLNSLAAKVLPVRIDPYESL